jgi:hypothetical protein
LSKSQEKQTSIQIEAQFKTIAAKVKPLSLKRYYSYRNAAIDEI